MVNLYAVVLLVSDAGRMYKHVATTGNAAWCWHVYGQEITARIDAGMDSDDAMQEVSVVSYADASDDIRKQF